MTNPTGITLKQLADEYGVSVDGLRNASNVGPEVEEDAVLNQLQEQNARNSWEQSRNA